MKVWSLDINVHGFQNGAVGRPVCSRTASTRVLHACNARETVCDMTLIYKGKPLKNRSVPSCNLGLSLPELWEGYQGRDHFWMQSAFVMPFLTKVRSTGPP